MQNIRTLFSFEKAVCHVLAKLDSKGEYLQWEDDNWLCSDHKSGGSSVPNGNDLLVQTKIRKYGEFLGVCSSMLYYILVYLYL